MIIREVIEYLELIAPRALQESYDNSGLIAGDGETSCSGILICLDCTEAVVQEAIEKKCNLVISHHPLIFRPVRSITPYNASGKTLIAAIRADIALYAIHTNLDNVFHGVNSAIADKLQLINRKILNPRAGLPDVGSGMLGELQEPIQEERFLAVLRDTFHVPVIRHSPSIKRPIHRVAICGGAGSFLINNALCESADIFVTADLKYHDFFEGDGKMILADIGHYESEQFTSDLLYKVILEKFPNFAVLKSGTLTNPVNYYI